MQGEGISPWRALANTAGHMIKGRVHFPRRRLGEVITMDDGQRFEIFRQAIVDRKDKKLTTPEARFILRFHLANMSPKMNKPFSLLPMPFCIGVPGFRAKLWTLNVDNGDFQGIYEFETVKDAENYSRSFAVRFMTGRSVPGSVSFKIIAHSKEE